MKLALQIGDIQIELTETVKAKYFFMATESELLANRQKIGSIGGFSSNEKITGEYKDKEGNTHTIEVDKTTLIGNTIFIYVDNKLVYSKTGTTNDTLLGCFGLLTISSLIGAIILLVLLLF